MIGTGKDHDDDEHQFDKIALINLTGTHPLIIQDGHEGEIPLDPCRTRRSYMAERLRMFRKSLISVER